MTVLWERSKLEKYKQKRKTIRRKHRSKLKDGNISIMKQCSVGPKMDAEDPNRPSEKTVIPKRNSVSILRGREQSTETTRKEKRKRCSRVRKRRKLIRCLMR